MSSLPSTYKTISIPKAADMPSSISNNSPKLISAKPISQLYEIYINGSITEASDYVEVFSQIRNLGELDFIKIHINSYGGDLFTAIQFMRVLAETPATVICSVEGACMSAATLIFLCGNEYEISHHSAFMIHTYSGGMMGKGSEMFAQSMFERKWSVDLINSAYSDFLTKEEITTVLAGGDLWMSAEDVIKRLEKKTSVRRGPSETEKSARKKGKTKKPLTKTPQVSVKSIQE